jgi:hypothetical protein
VLLGSRLMRVTDATTRALVEHACPVQRLKLSRSATDASLLLLAGALPGSGPSCTGPASGASEGCGGDCGGGGGGLAALDLRRNLHVTAAAVVELARRCAPLALLRLPQHLACVQAQLAGEGWVLKQAAAAKEWFELVR